MTEATKEVSQCQLRILISIQNNYHGCLFMPFMHTGSCLSLMLENPCPLTEHGKGSIHNDVTLFGQCILYVVHKQNGCHISLHHCRGGWSINYWLMYSVYCFILLSYMFVLRIISLKIALQQMYHTYTTNLLV